MKILMEMYRDEITTIIILITREQSTRQSDFFFFNKRGEEASRFFGIKIKGKSHDRRLRYCSERSDSRCLHNDLETHNIPPLVLRRASELFAFYVPYPCAPR